MAHEKIQLTTVTCILAADTELVEALGCPEISALAGTERAAQAMLQAKAKTILEDSGLSPALSLHRRLVKPEPEVREQELTLEPPKRSPDWQEPVTLRLSVVRWVEGDDLHQAYVPALGILVFAPREALLEERLKEHVRLVLLGRRKRVDLRHLAQLERIQSLKIGKVEITARIAPPKEVAMSMGAGQEKSSMLETLAEELQPRAQRPPSTNAPATNTAEGKAGGLPPPFAFELEAELAKLAEVLAGAQRRSVLLVGPAGCGKTALVLELARRRRDFGFGHTPFWSTGGARLMAGEIGFGMWQERCQKLCREAAKTNSILHLGNLAELLEVGKVRRDQQSVGGFLRPWIARGEILAIAECTPEQVSLIERNEPHLLDAFLQLQIPERTPEQTRAILSHVFEAADGKIPETEAGYRSALDRLHQLHLRYAIYSANPGRPIRFLKNLLADHFPEKSLSEPQVTNAFSRETGLPLVLLDDRLPLDLEDTREWFSKRLIGQPKAISRVVDLLAIIKSRLARPKKPLASFLFIGPTGTGKTELAKALAEFLFGDAGRLARFDLNQFNDPVSLQRLIGGPGTEGREGLLTARVREQPFSVLLLDEFEKADAGFFDLLLQILGDGRLTDAAGRVADFCNCVIVMTSNLGAQGFQRGPAGFRADGSMTPDAHEHFTDAVRKFLRPEIFNRLDAVVPFRPLPPEVVLSIAQRHVDLLRQRDGVRLRPIELHILPEVAEYLAQKGYDTRYGARPLKRAIEKELLAPLAEAIAQYSERLPLIIKVAVARTALQIEVKPELVSQPGEADAFNPARSDLAGAITLQRRLIAKLKACSAASELENQLAMSEALARRLKIVKWKSPELQVRLARLPKIRECLEAVTTLHDRAKELETEALSAFYRREHLDPSLFGPELNARIAERQRLLREVFRLRIQDPNDIVLALYSEDFGALMEFAAAYYDLAKGWGQVVALDFFVPPPGGRSRASTAVRQTPKKPNQPFEAVPEKTIGVVLHLRGELFFPRFEHEAGLHVLKDKDTERICLVESSRPPFAEYQPPRGIERQGGIKSLGARTRRTFNREESEVKDSHLGERPWRGITLERCLGELVEEFLQKKIEAVTG